MLKLIRRRTIWLPTLMGWICLVGIIGGAGTLWFMKGESFLALTERQPAEVLVVEGWISAAGVNAAKAEFQHGGYRYVIATSGLTGNRWDERRWSYAAEAEEQLLRGDIPRDQVILATPKDTENQRTFESALAVRKALRTHDLHPKSLNLMTRDVHARRSRLVFAKVLGPEIKVGVIAWQPPGYVSEPWWQSSERAEDMLKESLGYWFELLLNSGRFSNSPPADQP